MLQLGDLHNANERMVLLELESAPPGDASDGHNFKAAEWLLSFQRNGAPVQFSGSVDLIAVKDRSALGKEAASVQAMFAIRRSSDFDSEIARYLSERDKRNAKEAKSRQISLLKDTLDIARNAPEIDPVDIEALEAVLRRAEVVAEQLDDGEDMEIVRRQCVQEMELNRAMSVAGFSDGCDSSDGEDGPTSQALAQQRRLRDFDDMSDASSSDGNSNARVPVQQRRTRDFDNISDGSLSDDDSLASHGAASTAPNSPRPLPDDGKSADKEESSCTVT